ncbi:MAG: hypothetical protein ABIS92_12275 [Polyangia bacterium]
MIASQDAEEPQTAVVLRMTSAYIPALHGVPESEAPEGGAELTVVE